MKILIKPYFIGSIVIIAFLSYVVLDIAKGAAYTPKLHIDITFSILTIILSVAIAVSAILQTIISNRNIKLQMFDKRYKVFKVIVSSSILLSEKNYSNQILSIGLDDPNFINKKVMASVEEMQYAAILSQTLFDKELSSKVFKANNKYKALTDIHYTILKQHIALINNKEFGELFKSQLLTIDENEIASINKEINKVFPSFQPAIERFNSEVDLYNEWLSESKLLEDFDKYLKISELDNI